MAVINPRYECRHAEGQNEGMQDQLRIYLSLILS